MQFLVCVLFTGILGSTYGEYHIPDRTKIYEKMYEIAKKSCFDNGGQYALDMYTRGNQEVRNCLSTPLGELTEHAKRNPLRYTLNLYCTEVVTLKRCVRIHADSMKACKEPGKPENLYDPYGMIARMLDFICINKKKIAGLIFVRCITSEIATSEEKAVATLTRDQCVMQQFKAALGCARNFVSDVNATVIHTDTRLLSSLPFDVDKEVSRIMEDVEKCAFKELSKCENKLVAELLDSMFKYINNPAPYVDPEESYASPASVVNFPLLIAAIAISLYNYSK